MYTPWRKLETGEIIYRPWKRFGSAYIVDDKYAERVVAFNEALATVFFPIVFALVTAWTPHSMALLGSAIRIIEFTTVLLIITLVFNFTSLKRYCRLERDESHDNSNISDIYPISNRSNRLLFAFKMGIGVALAQSTFSNPPDSFFLPMLSLLLVFIGWGVWKIIQIRLDGWSEAPIF
jgi:hypothetical protein